MGFMDFMGKMIKGETVFTNESVSGRVADDWDDRPVIDPQSARRTADDSLPRRFDAHGNKQIPEVMITHVENHPSGSHVDVWVRFRNTSSFVVELDKIQIFGRTTELDYQLTPGQEREMKAYSGDRMTDNSYHKAEVYYKDKQSGDYFRADYQIEYKYEHDKSYSVDELRLIHPIHDI